MLHAILEGKEIKHATPQEAAKFFNSPQRILAQDRTPCGKLVSTVFLCIHHPGGFFETMVFGSDGKALHQERYETYDKAIKGHARILKEFTC